VIGFASAPTGDRIQKTALCFVASGSIRVAINFLLALCLFRTCRIDTFRSLKSNTAMRAVAKRFVRGSAAATKCNARFINCNSVSIGVEEINWTFNDVRSVFRRTNSYVCHSYLPQVLLCETAGSILTWHLVGKFRVSGFEFRVPCGTGNLKPQTAT